MTIWSKSMGMWHGIAEIAQDFRRKQAKQRKGKGIGKLNKVSTLRITTV